MVNLGGGRLGLGMLGLAVILAVPPSRTGTQAADIFTSSGKIARLFEVEQDLVGLVRGMHDGLQGQPAMQRELDSVLQVVEHNAAEARKLQAASRLLASMQVHASDAFKLIYRNFAVVQTLANLTANASPRTASRGQAELASYLKDQRSAGSLPDMEDIQGAAASMLRLTRTYDRPVSELLPDGSAAIYYLVARTAIAQEDWASAVAWLAEALHAYAAQQNSSSDSHFQDDAHGLVDLLQLLEWQAWAYYKAGDLGQAIRVSQELLARQPRNYRVKDNLESYLYKQQRSQDQTAAEPTLIPSKKFNYNPDNQLRHSQQDMQRYRLLCRGQPTRLTKRIYANPKLTGCSYEHYHNPAHYLKPFAVESILKTEQDIKVFKHFLSDDECDHVISVAFPEIHRSTAYNGSKLTTTDYRISQNTWIKPNTDNVIARLHERARAATGLNVSWAEDLQVANYGLGGNYEPHYDWGSQKMGVFKTMGNRLATLMVYLSDVHDGGYTVFPRLGVGAKPKKGDAIFWMNMQKGEGDTLTLHAGCPVLNGSKWVANLWIHEGGHFT